MVTGLDGLKMGCKKMKSPEGEICQWLVAKMAGLNFRVNINYCKSLGQFQRESRESTTVPAPCTSVLSSWRHLVDHLMKLGAGL